jgi:hypothetical protein
VELDISVFLCLKSFVPYLGVAHMVCRKRFRHSLECSSHGGGHYAIFLQGCGRTLWSPDTMAKVWPSSGVAGHSLYLLLPSELVSLRRGTGAYYTCNKIITNKNVCFMLSFISMKRTYQLATEETSKHYVSTTSHRSWFVKTKLKLNHNILCAFIFKNKIRSPTLWTCVTGKFQVLGFHK